MMEAKLAKGHPAESIPAKVSRFVRAQSDVLGFLTSMPYTSSTTSNGKQCGVQKETITIRLHA
jgi:hypothetical protein